MISRREFLRKLGIGLGIAGSGVAVASSKGPNIDTVMENAQGVPNVVYAGSLAMAIDEWEELREHFKESHCWIL